MVKHTQTIRRLFQTNCLSVFDHFVGLTVKGLIQQTGFCMISLGGKSLFFNLEPNTKLKKQKTECSPKARNKFNRSQTEATPAVPPISKAMEDSIKNQRDNPNLDVGSQLLVSIVTDCERKCRGVSNHYDGKFFLN